MDKLSEVVLYFVISRGACAAGIAATQTLEGGPPSTDLSYVLPDAKSAVSFAVAVDQGLIPPYFMKKDHLALEQANYRAYTLSSGISLELATYLEMKGIPSTSVVSNRRYRSEPPNSVLDMAPDISHRYLAVRSGVGHFGLSGNVITNKAGAAVILGTVVTTAELSPTDPLPDSENYCDECKLCMASCASGFMDKSEQQHITMGGVDFSYSMRRNYERCMYVCGGLTGADEDFEPAFQKALEPYSRWPKIEGGHYHFLIDAKVRTTCAHCQFICCPDKTERKKRYEMLTRSGVVVQSSNGTLEVVSPQEAIKILSRMPDEKRRLYEDTT